MDFEKQKTELKKIRKQLLSSECELHIEFASELIETVNTLIGRINCYITDDDKEVERLAVVDKIRGTR